MAIRPDSWVGKGPNKQVAPGDLANALGADQIEALTSQSGLSRDELLQGLSKFLPDVVNHLTPDGRLPDENELSAGFDAPSLFRARREHDRTPRLAPRHFIIDALKRDDQ